MHHMNHETGAIDQGTVPVERRAGGAEAASETDCLVALSMLRGVGYWTLWHLAESADAFRAVLFTESPEELLAMLHAAGAKTRPEDVADWARNRRELLARAGELLVSLARCGGVLLMPGDPRFPAVFELLESGPKRLFVQGDISLLSTPQIGVVGTRTPTDDGAFLGKYVAFLASRTGRPIVSGLASGIDTIPHEVAIRAEAPTVAILGTGLCFKLGASAERLKDAILASDGAIVSEYPSWQGYTRQLFVRRNRLQAALASVVVPAEWSLQGGTAHTVRFALKYGRSLAGLRMPDWSLGERLENLRPHILVGMKHPSRKPFGT